MGFGEAISTCLRKYVTFSGRARRAEYWWFFLFCVLIEIVTEIVDRIVAPGYTAAHSSGPVSTGMSIALLLPSLSVFVRRLHDINRTGWWALVFYVVLAVLFFAALAAFFNASFSLGGALMLAIFAICIWMIALMATKGTTGPNRYGHDPLAIANATAPAPAPAE
jgi:uncharacterized membrane protein YhaH (DUF805 family)